MHQKYSIRSYRHPYGDGGGAIQKVVPSKYETKAYSAEGGSKNRLAPYESKAQKSNVHCLELSHLRLAGLPL